MNANDRGAPPEWLRRYVREAGISRAVKAIARRLGFDLVGRDYYSPIPDLARLPPDVWTSESELPGLTLDVRAGLDFVRVQLAPYLREYAPPHQPTTNPRDFFLDNGFYGAVDAELLYATIRHLKPRRVLELGSGASTLVIADARVQNQLEGSEHRAFDPFPREELLPVLEQIVDVRRVSATDVPLEEFARLGEGDVLFVDTTHTVKLASDVNRIILEVLPRLAPGVHIHFHDIFLPWQYPRRLLDMGFFWAEQYLLQAFLGFNREFEVVLSTHALHRRYPGEVAKLVKSAPAPVPPSSFWLRRTSSPMS